jgi:hypothetical protein
MAFHMFYHRHMRALGAPVQMHDDDDQVLTFREWCELNAISPTTGRRILAGGDGPVVTALSAKRIGINAGRESGVAGVAGAIVNAAQKSCAGRGAWRPRPATC